MGSEHSWTSLWLRIWYKVSMTFFRQRMKIKFSEVFRLEIWLIWIKMMSESISQWEYLRGHWGPRPPISGYDTAISLSWFLDDIFLYWFSRRQTSVLSLQFQFQPWKSDKILPSIRKKKYICNHKKFFSICLQFLQKSTNIFLELHIFQRHTLNVLHARRNERKNIINPYKVVISFFLSK